MTKKDLIIWDKKAFEIGIDVIDQQHQTLVNYINNVASSINSQQDSAHTTALFNKLYDYIVLHFKAEEAYFFKLNKNDGLLHELQHKHFIEELDRIILSNEFQDNGHALLYYLTDWLIHHIQVEDKKFIMDNQHQT